MAREPLQCGCCVRGSRHVTELFAATRAMHRLLSVCNNELFDADAGAKV